MGSVAVRKASTCDTDEKNHYIFNVAKKEIISSISTFMQMYYLESYLLSMALIKSVNMSYKACKNQAAPNAGIMLYF